MRGEGVGQKEADAVYIRLAFVCGGVFGFGVTVKVANRRRERQGNYA